MSQKAWMQAYTKGSKAMQDRLAKVHRNNPEFQEFVKKHGFGGNLSVKQSGLQKKGSVQTVKPVTDPHPEKSDLDREAMIKAAAEKLRNRRQANANRVAFGGELGGGFQLPGSSFRRYSESIDESGPYAAMIANKKQKDYEELVRRETQERDEINRMNDFNAVQKHRDEVRKKMKKGFTYTPKKWVKEDITYKDGTIAMYKGGWIAKRGSKRLGAVVPTDDHAKKLIDATHKSLGQKTVDVITRKRQEIARGLGRFSLATESAANRRRIRSWDSAILPVERDHPLTVKPKQKPPFDPDPPRSNPGVVVGRNKPEVSRVRHLARLGLKKAVERDNINKTVDYISNPKYSVLDKNKINSLLKGK